MIALPVLFMFPLFVPCPFQLVATLPEDVQPGPDFYGLPWNSVLLTACLGIVWFAVFFWRTVLAVSEFPCSLTEEYIEHSVIIGPFIFQLLT